MCAVCVLKVNSSSSTFCSTDLSSIICTAESSPMPGEAHSALQSMTRQCSLVDAKFQKVQKQNIEKYHVLKQIKKRIITPCGSQ